MDVEGLYWNKINVLIDIVLIGGVGGGGGGWELLYFQFIFN